MEYSSRIAFPFRLRSRQRSRRKGAQVVRRHAAPGHTRQSGHVPIPVSCHFVRGYLGNGPPGAGTEADGCRDYLSRCPGESARWMRSIQERNRRCARSSSRPPPEMFTPLCKHAGSTSATGLDCSTATREQVFAAARGLFRSFCPLWTNTFAIAAAPGRSSPSDRCWRERSLERYQEDE